ncbi:hypothetical protein GCM10022255_080700 [Dactylosporangium darangshiense]|uniref:Uncharacterized protein n=1 Tax=Dactylosporangium darangshiense TaxID=579108 RepID=A0ABP8DL31_9ACTN
MVPRRPRRANPTTSDKCAHPRHRRRSNPCDGLASRATAEACAIEHGYRFVDTYQPLTRFWPFQLIESGIFVGLSITVLAVAVWWILRRTA